MNKYWLFQTRLMCGLTNILSCLDRFILCFLVTSCAPYGMVQNKRRYSDSELIEMEEYRYFPCS
jgi:hypothetical protein